MRLPRRELIAAISRRSRDNAEQHRDDVESMWFHGCTPVDVGADSVGARLWADSDDTNPPGVTTVPSARTTAPFSSWTEPSGRCSTIVILIRAVGLDPSTVTEVDRAVGEQHCPVAERAAGPAHGTECRCRRRAGTAGYVEERAAAHVDAADADAQVQLDERCTAGVVVRPEYRGGSHCASSRGHRSCRCRRVRRAALVASSGTTTVRVADADLDSLSSRHWGSRSTSSSKSPMPVRYVGATVPSEPTKTVFVPGVMVQVDTGEAQRRGQRRRRPRS